MLLLKCSELIDLMTGFNIIMSKVKRKIKRRHPQKVYVMRRILVIAILLIIISVVGIVISYLLKEVDSLRKKHNANIENYKIEEMRLNLNIKEKSYQWSEPLSYTNNPNKIIIHHSASKEINVEAIDKMHRGKGWSGIGYHYFINKKGEIYQGRPEKAIGAHAYKNNQNTIGVCIEGNFEEEIIEETEYKSLINLLKYISLKYPIKEIQGHRDVVDTLCPGKNIKDKEIKQDVINAIKKLEETD